MPTGGRQRERTLPRTQPGTALSRTRNSSRGERMRALGTKVNVHSGAYKSNVDAMSALCARLQSELAKSRAGGGEKYNRRHVEQGKLLPRERIELLLDRDSYFLEL